MQDTFNNETAARGRGFQRSNQSSDSRSSSNQSSNNRSRDNQSRDGQTRDGQFKSFRSSGDQSADRGKRSDKQSDGKYQDRRPKFSREGSAGEGKYQDRRPNFSRAEGSTGEGKYQDRRPKFSKEEGHTGEGNYSEGNYRPSRKNNSGKDAFSSQDRFYSKGSSFKAKSFGAKADSREFTDTKGSADFRKLDSEKPRDRNNGKVRFSGDRKDRFSTGESGKFGRSNHERNAFFKGDNREAGHKEGGYREKTLRFKKNDNFKQDQENYSNKEEQNLQNQDQKQAEFTVTEDQAVTPVISPAVNPEHLQQITVGGVSFADLGLEPILKTMLNKAGFNNPTKIQELAIPMALEGKDILASAETGSGKTAAFVLPMLNNLLNNKNNMALVLLPTRELAVQVIAVVHKLLPFKSGIDTALLIGGEPMPKQLRQLKMRPRIIVGTPGRIFDHLQRASLKLNNAGFLVLDETDRMLDMGFGVQLDAIAEYLPKIRQTLMFSATIPAAIGKVASKYLTNPERIEVGTNNAPAKNIKQDQVFVNSAEKYGELKKQLDTRTGSVIIFVKTKFGADRLAKKLDEDGHTSRAIHGDLRQKQRDNVIYGFRNSRYRILVATDIAARGLDIPHIEHVINYDLPQCPEDYIHRIGRTARAGASGASLCLIGADERGKWRAIQRLINPDEHGGKDADSDGENRGPGRRRSFGGRSGGSGRSFKVENRSRPRRSFGGDRRSS